LFKGVQTNLSPKTGKKTKSTRYVEKDLVTDNPDDIVAFLYGPKYKARDIRTFDQALKAVKSSSFPYPNERKKIYKMTSDSLQKLGFPVPEELAKLL